ncbi:hypothetical protein Bbelb_256330 [Branchiostoma belcheri]|nr:hypothetical protein Bbelb_256330 [Branchiostoma belcheri]
METCCICRTTRRPRCQPGFVTTAEPPRAAQSGVTEASYRRCQSLLRSFFILKFVKVREVSVFLLGGRDVSEGCGTGVRAAIGSTGSLEVRIPAERVTTRFGTLPSLTRAARETNIFPNRYRRPQRSSRSSPAVSSEDQGIGAATFRKAAGMVMVLYPRATGDLTKNGLEKFKNPV